MKIPAMVAAEFRRLTATRMSVIALVALSCVPILYGGLYLWANQDPYGRLDEVPVALVVADRGATVDGTQTDYGDQVAKDLVAGHSFDWHRVSAKEAAAGVRDSRYDFSVTLPAEFSADLASVASADPRKARVVLTTNDANSYLASTIGKQAVQTLRATVAQEVNEQAAARFLSGLATVRDQLSQAASATHELQDGAGTAASGAQQVASGTSAAASSSHELASGLTSLSAGAQQVANGNAQLAQKADQAGALAQQATAQLPAIRAAIQSQLAAAGVDQATIDAVLARLDPLGSALQSGNARVQQVVSSIDALAAGSREVASGASTAASGAGRLASGLDTLAGGASSLSSGLGTLRDGTGRLASALDSGVAQLPATDAASRARQAKAIADPVSVEDASVASAGTYGAGLAPFFASLAAWIGVYALFLIVKPVSRRAITALRSPLRVTLAGWLTPGVLGMVQMAALFLVIALALRFPIADPGGVYGIMALASLAFTAIVLALNVWLGSVGQFLGLVLMVLQLVTAGGTFPWQTLPGPLAALHHVLPMGFAVDGIRQLMYGGDTAAAAHDCLVLVCWLAGGLVLAAAGVIRMTHTRTMRDLAPSLIG